MFQACVLSPRGGFCWTRTYFPWALLAAPRHGCHAESQSLFSLSRSLSHLFSPAFILLEPVSHSLPFSEGSQIQETRGKGVIEMGLGRSVDGCARNLQSAPHASCHSNKANPNAHFRAGPASRLTPRGSPSWAGSGPEKGMLKRRHPGQKSGSMGKPCGPEDMGKAHASSTGDSGSSHVAPLV